MELRYEEYETVENIQRRMFVTLSVHRSGGPRSASQVSKQKLNCVDVDGNGDDDDDDSTINCAEQSRLATGLARRLQFTSQQDQAVAMDAITCDEHPVRDNPTQEGTDEEEEAWPSWTDDASPQQSLDLQQIQTSESLTPSTLGSADMRLQTSDHFMTSASEPEIEATPRMIWMS